MKPHLAAPVDSAELSPLTGTNCAYLISRFDAEDLIRAWASELKVDIRPELHGISHFNLYECGTTELQFFRPIELAGSSNLYEKLQQFSWYYQPDKWEYHQAIKDFAGMNSIVEVGAGEGAFLRLCQQSGFKACGIELNPRAAAEAQSAGFQVECESMSSLFGRYGLGHWDAACAFQVLEHVSEPREFLELLFNAVRPGGRIALAVPNRDSFIRRERNILDLPPHHMSRWSARTFQAVEKLYPVRLLDVIEEPLGMMHFGYYVAVQSKRLQGLPLFLQQMFVNRITIGGFRVLIKLGLLPMIKGQGLYALFERK